VARFLIPLLGSLGLIAAAPTGVIASESSSPPPQTDADLVTAIDVSGSIDGYAEWLQLAGMADALDHPELLRAIREGSHGRIGFVVFTWSSGGDFVELVPWTEIGSAADARRVAEQLRAARGMPRLGYSEASDPRRRTWRRNLATDISAALEHALEVLDRTPFHADRRLINLCTNGEDNVGEGPDRARDRAAAAGTVINGVIVGPNEVLAAYLREHVQTGAGSFVIQVDQLGTVTDSMLQKFLMEVASLHFY
jgi:hypothetical protein